MQIQLNGEAHQLEAEFSVEQLLTSLALADQRVAVEINQEIVPRSTFAEHRLCEGDQVEIVRAIGGG